MTERVEKQLGNYRLRHLVGIGAFADVYLGTHIYLNSRVAIKILHTHLDELTIEGFRNEARHLSHLAHPHIIRVLDFGIEDEIPFLVMDYAPRGNLRQRHPQGDVVPLLTVLSYVNTIAAALQYTHDQHLIHRDLKPENLLVGEQGEILLSDFGLALIASGLEPLRVQEHLGTLAYMAPEQIAGHVCSASDQFALAVMAYEWLSGRHPFAGYGGELVNQQLFDSIAPLCVPHAEIPPAVEQVLFRALAKDPAQRFADDLSFAHALDEASQPISPLAFMPGQPAVASTQTEAVRPGLASSLGYIENLPLPLTPLLGRERELQLAHTRLLRPEVRLLTLIGSPGVGKTRLAQALSAALQANFAQGVCFVGLTAISKVEQVVPAILRALGQPESRDTAPREHLIAFLRQKQLLLVLDNFEQVLAAAPLLTEVLSACPQLKILVTSRAALHVQGEFELAVPPLAIPDPRVRTLPGELAQVASVALFVERVEAIKPGFALSAQNADLIDELCVRLGGVPLAIELAAARCKLLSLDALLSRLKQGFEVLMGSNQNAPSRQQTLRNTISWSYTLLSEEEQALFRRLCTFVGEFSLETAEAVVTAPGYLSISVLDGILSLIDKSLLQQREEQAHESRLWILEIIRAFGLEQLDESGELELCRQAQALYYLALAERDEEGLRGAGQLALLNQLELEYENLRAAMLWFLEHHEIAAALRLPTALREFWFLRGRLNDGRKFLTRALEASREDDTLKISHLQARALYAAGYLAARQQEPEEAASYLAASLELFLRQEDKGGIAACLSRLGFIEYMRGEVAQGKAMIAESLALSRAIGDRRNSADIRLSLGIGALYEGRFNEARKQLGEGLALFDAEGDVWGKASELHTLGMTFYAQKNYARARQLSEESLTLLRSMDSPYGTAEVLTVLACELAALGEIPRARSLLEEALALANTRASSEDQVHVLCGVACIELQEGHLAEACACLEEGLTKMQYRWYDPRSKWVLATCLEGLAEAALNQGSSAWAVQLCACAEIIRGAQGYYCSLGREQATYDHTLAEARRHLGEKAYAAAWAEGQDSAPRQVVAEAIVTAPLEEVKARGQVNQRPPVTSGLPGGLTAREIEVLGLLAQGLSNNQIAVQLVLSPYTVNSHTQSIYGKLGINSRSAATRFAVEHNLLALQTK